jgi:large subunit ribosomal protein L23
MKDISNILKRPRITEKASLKNEKGVYVFEIPQSSTKKDVEKAVKDLYKVVPVKVGVVNIPSKNVFVRGKRGVKSGYKKAYVYLKKGEKIEVM